MCPRTSQKSKFKTEQNVSQCTCEHLGQAVNPVHIYNSGTQWTIKVFPNSFHVLTFSSKINLIETEHTFRGKIKTKCYFEVLYLPRWLQNVDGNLRKNIFLFISCAISYLQRQTAWSLSHIIYGFIYQVLSPYSKTVSREKFGIIL